MTERSRGRPAHSAGERHRSTLQRPTWRTVAGSYAALAALLLSLWAVGDPLAAGLAVAATAALRAVTRRAVWLYRCLQDCRELTVDVAGRVEITVTRTWAEEAC